MEPCFRITGEPLTATLRVEMSGFFGPGDIERFCELRDAELRRLKTRPNQHVTLVDIRGMKIQSQDSVDGFAAMLNDSRAAARKIAFVVEASLARMQLKRAAEGRGAGFFMSSEEAVAWLAEP